MYAVYGASNVFSVIKASSRDEAFDIFASNQIKSEILNEYISGFIINDGFFESFYRDDTGYLMDNITGELPERVLQLNEDQQDSYVDSWIEKNINHFWEEEPQFATEYLNELNKARESNDFYKPTFSHDFWVSTIKKIIQRGNWYDAFDIVKINLADHNYQQIYLY